MKLISFEHREANSPVFKNNLISLWYRMRLYYNKEPTLRAFGAVIALPFAKHTTYMDGYCENLVEGWRIAVLDLFVSLDRSNLMQSQITLRCYLEPVGKIKLVASREAIESGLYVI